MHRIILFICLGLAAKLAGQSDIALGQWASYLPYNTGLFLTQSEDKVIYGTRSSLFTIDKEDFSIDFISKVDGLSETGISAIEYDPYNDQLIVAYQNSIIDFVNGQDVFPVFNIKETDFIQGDKTIYDIFVQNDEFVYFATGFGVVQYNMQKREFGFTLDARQKVSSIEGNNEWIVIAAEDGAYTLDMDVITPNFFGSWEKISAGLPDNYDAVSVLELEGKLYVATENDVYAGSRDDTLQSIYSKTDPDFDIIFINETPEGWLLGLRDSGTSSKIVVFDAMDVPLHEISDCTNRLRDALIDEQGRLFIADDWEGIRYKNDYTGVCEPHLIFNSPKSDEASDIDIENERVFIASGGITDNFQNLFGREGFSILEEREWLNFHENSTPFIFQNDLIQLYTIEAHPDEPVVYVGSFWAGLIRYNYETGEFSLFDESNSTLRGQVGDEQRVKVSGLAFDEDNNLWVSNFGAARPLSVYTAEGEWYSFQVPGDTRIVDLAIDQAGFVWAVVGGASGGVIIYDPGESISDLSDNPQALLKNSANSEIPSNIVNSIAVDIEGEVWVGTTAGVAVFACGGGVFENPCDGIKPTVFQDSIGAYLLETEDVLSIAVDGANRKWFGTRNGIFVQSVSGKEQIAHFTTENSLLFDNTIQAMAFNPETGEMFISTNKGLQSYRTFTTGARPVHSNEVYAFPNPVRPEYNGVIAIKGLARDAEVKITDIQGQLVFQTLALGGQAIWDGTDIKGRKVAGGVYLVFSSSSDDFRDPNSYVTKILLVR